MFQDFFKLIIQGSDFNKGLFLAAAGILFVFAVQIIFYVIIKLFVRFGKAAS